MTDYKPLQGRWSNRTIHGKLSAPEVYAIRREWRNDLPVSVLTRGVWAQRVSCQFHVSRNTVLDVVDRRSWTRLPPEPVYWKSDPSAFWSWWLTIWIFLSLCEMKPRLTLEATVQTG